MATDIIINGVSKSFEKEGVPALDQINLSVNQGELYGLVGPDGAGKTTLFRILTTLLLADAGNATVHGWDVVKDYTSIRRHIGYMPGKFSLYQDLSVEENLTFFASIFHTSIQENYPLIRDIYVQLEPFKNRKAGNLSGGMKQKLALCCALIHRPKVLFLDEPTTGVDTVSRKEFWDMLKNLKVEGITIFVATPYMDEATLCERIALIQKGRLLSVDSPKAIVENFPFSLYAIKSKRMSLLLNQLRSHPLIRSVYAFGEYHHITFYENDPSTMEQFTQSLPADDLVIRAITPSIEDCFIQLMSTEGSHA